MTVHVGPSIQRTVIDMALGGECAVPLPGGKGRDTVGCLPPAPPRWGGLTGSDLLAAAGGMEYAKAVSAGEGDYRRLADRARALVSALVVSQREDGGWPWVTRHQSDWAGAAMSLWALGEAKKQGIAVDENALAKAKTFLHNAFTRVSANDNDAKAVILHALSTVGSADFANVNRLYRERNALSSPALAYTALAMANLGRPEFAKEILDVLGSKAKTQSLQKRRLASWDGAPAHLWMEDRVEATAVALLAITKVRPQSPHAKAAAEFLVNQRGCYGYTVAKSHGPAVAALGAYYGKARFAAAQYKLTVEVNGKEVRTIEAQAGQPSILLLVPGDCVKAGKNMVVFRMNGRGEYAYSATLRGFSPDVKDAGDTYVRPHVRHYYHAPLEYRGRPLGAASTSPVANAEIGQRVHVTVGFSRYGSSRRGFLAIEEHLPAGMTLVVGSVTGSFNHYEVGPAKITMYCAPGHYVGGISYQLVGYSTGQYRALPTVVRDVLNPGRMRIGPVSNINVLAPGEASKDPYRWNNGERFAMGSAYFNDGLYAEALKYLSELHKIDRTYNERELARMLLWIYTTPEFYDAKRIVAMFEVLRERHPDLVIPFDRILVVGRAYRDIGEFERALYVFRATIDASFINDSNVSAILQDEGQFLTSVDFQEDLWREYPDTPEVVASYFGLSQLLYQRAPQAHVQAKDERRIALTGGQTKAPPTRVPNKIDMLSETLWMLSSFMTLYPESPLADDAAFSQANALLELKNHKAVVALCKVSQERYPKSEFASGFQYMTALGYFWQRDYAEALKAGHVVAEGASKDRDFARYILGQIHHAQGKPALAIEWYAKVRDLYPDAREAIGYFEEKRIALEEVTISKPDQPVELKLKYRNIKEAALQVYRVDLMKLYLREKNLATMTKVNLSGIRPEVEQTLTLGDGKDYVDKETIARLGVKGEAAYLVICRGDDLFTSGVVLVTPLKIEVQEDAVSGRIRANVIDAVSGQYVPEVHVKAIGSADSEFRSGQTDLRGIFVADGLRGKATVIARVGDSRYAFYRGEKHLGAPTPAAKPPAAMPGGETVDYQRNIERANYDLQERNLKVFETQRRQSRQGVEVQQAQ